MSTFRLVFRVDNAYYTTIVQILELEARTMPLALSKALKRIKVGWSVVEIKRLPQ